MLLCTYFGRVPHVFAEYVPGGSLEDWIKDRQLYAGGKEKALERILDIASKFAWGLEYAHEQAFVHQDVRPENVLLTTDGLVKVTDFGLAKWKYLYTDIIPSPNEKEISHPGTIIARSCGHRRLCIP